jgi:quercetin dioxygenase-like cupin family protein
MRRFMTLTTAVVSVIVLTINMAMASPPNGPGFSWQERGRGTSVDAGPLKVDALKEVLVASYTLDPGASSGWRDNPNSLAFIVKSGSLSLLRSGSCDAKEYKAGDAGFVPAGRYLMQNRGSGPLEIVATYFGLPTDAPTPMTADAVEQPPAGCVGEASVPTGKIVVGETYGKALLTRRGSHSGVSDRDTVDIEKGKDIFTSSYHLDPGESVGWANHPGPVLFVMNKGTLTLYEGHDGECKKEVIHAGEAALTFPGHQHLANNESQTEPIELVDTYFNLENHVGAVPALGNQLDARREYAPPADCPRVW